MRFCVTCGRRFEEDLLFCPDDGQRTEAVPDEETTQVIDRLLGRTVDGRYRIEKKIGEGGMGNVYLATHVVLNRKLALKVLAGDMARNPEVVQRFQQEAQSATAIGHQNIIDIQDFGRLPDGTAYFVMEYLDGLSLTGLLEQEGALDVPAIIKIARQIAEALDAAHARGIVHRDLKPDNISVIQKGEDPRFVKVLDFGIAKVGGAASRLTQTGVIFGTPHYMAPEQAAGQAVDHRADIYSLGIILYEMSVGKVPFDADTYMGILSKHMFENPPVDPTAVPGRALGALKPVVLKALQKKPDDRYSSMRELIADFDAITAGRAPSVTSPSASPPVASPVSDPPTLDFQRPRPKTKLITAMGIALGVLGVGAWLVLASSGDPAPKDSGAAKLEQAPARKAPTGGDAASSVPSSPASPTAAPVAPPPPPAPPRTAAIVTIPAGADVMLGDALVGTTPVELTCPPSGDNAVEYIVSLEGYVPATIRLEASCGPLSMTLKARPKVRAGKPQRSPDATPTQPPRKKGSDVVDPWGN
jgi:serine/threonine protein kinase